LEKWDNTVEFENAMVLIIFSAVLIGAVIYCVLAHFISYSWLKNRIIKRQKWDLNICCGQTDGGGINADIVFQERVPNCQVIEDIYNLPYREGEFGTVLCSHTIEHVDDPDRFFSELQRVGESVTIVIPPLYDVTAALNFFEHKHLFLSFKKKHNRLPKYVKLPFADWIHKKLGQINHPSSKIPLAVELLASLFSVNRRKQLLKVEKPLGPQ